MFDRFFLFWALFWGRDTCVKYSLERTREREGRLRAALAPILNHSKADGKAPPVKFSVDDCRRIASEVGLS